MADDAAAAGVVGELDERFVIRILEDGNPSESSVMLKPTHSRAQLHWAAVVSGTRLRKWGFRGLHAPGEFNQLSDAAEFLCEREPGELTTHFGFHEVAGSFRW
jgi:hypothetical protein